MISFLGRKLFNVAIVGPPSSGKTSISERLEKAGYNHISNDKVRYEIFDGRTPFDLENHEWVILYSEFTLRKHLRLLEGTNVVSDSCAYNDGLRRITLYTSPELRKYLAETRQELVRYLIDLRVDRDELIRRNEERRRTGEQSDNYNEWINNEWEEAQDFEDEFGIVHAFTYDNNTPGEQKIMIASLSDLLETDL